VTHAHPLDRPVWSALSGRQRSFTLGDELARRFVSEVGPFAAAADLSVESQAALAALVAGAEWVVTMEAQELAPPPGTAIRERAICNQMVAERLTAGGPADFDVVALSEADAPEMLALATLTKPGPFAGRTHELGSFVGVKHDGRLVAMAGERMRPEGFTEVSAVCTLPDYRGRGYAGGLMRIVAQRILDRGELPFLHVYDHNAGAIALYESLGFQLRRAMRMAVLLPGRH
jgi:predicted GNAT family acetyltransferase